MERSRSSSVEANVETYMLQTVHLSWSVAGGFRRWASAAAGPANRGVRDYGGNAAAVNADGAPRDSPATARLLRRRPAEELAHVLPGALIRRGVVRQGDAVLLAASEGEDPAIVCLLGVMSDFAEKAFMGAICTHDFFLKAMCLTAHLRGPMHGYPRGTARGGSCAELPGATISGRSGNGPSKPRRGDLLKTGPIFALSAPAQ